MKIHSQHFQTDDLIWRCSCNQPKVTATFNNCTAFFIIIHYRILEILNMLVDVPDVNTKSVMTEITNTELCRQSPTLNNVSSRLICFRFTTSQLNTRSKKVIKHVAYRLRSLSCSVKPLMFTLDLNARV